MIQCILTCTTTTCGTVYTMAYHLAALYCATGCSFDANSRKLPTSVIVKKKNSLGVTFHRWLSVFKVLRVRCDI